MQASLCVFLGQYKGKLGIGTFTETRVRVCNRFRIPDVTVMEIPFTRAKVIEDVPAAVIEIKSRDDQFDDIVEKPFEYAAYRIPNIIVLDPDCPQQ